MARLSDICLKIGSGATPTGGKSAYLMKGISLIRSQNVLDISFAEDGLAYISDEQARKLQNVEILEGDILLNITGDSVARVCIVPNHILPARVNQHVAIIRVDKTKADNNYILYSLIKSKKTLLALASAGSTRNALTKKMIEEFEVFLPSLAEQKRIASILSSLDDKIAVNRRINANLEAQAEALFKSWFVDFTPFKDQPFVDSELGPIPQGLKICQISDISHTLETGRRQKGGAVSEGIPSVGAEHVKGIGSYDYSKTKYISPEFANKLKTGKINGYELLIYKDGGKPGYFIPNFSIFGEGYPFDLCYLNEHVFKLDFLQNKGYNIFNYFQFKTNYVMSFLNAQGGKAAIPGINKKDIECIYTFAPNNPKVVEFGNFALPLFTKILRNCVENQRLAALRDTLLPKLMSGEIKL